MCLLEWDKRTGAKAKSDKFLWLTEHLRENKEIFVVTIMAFVLNLSYFLGWKLRQSLLWNHLKNICRLRSMINITCILNLL